MPCIVKKTFEEAAAALDRRAAHILSAFSFTRFSKSFITAVPRPWYLYRRGARRPTRAGRPDG
jgi:hypothetical protein